MLWLLTVSAALLCGLCSRRLGRTWGWQTLELATATFDAASFPLAIRERGAWKDRHLAERVNR